MTLLRLLAGAALALPCLAQNTPDLARILSFETEHANGFPGGWSGAPRETISVDDKVVHGGKWSVRLERKEDAAGSFTAINKSLPMDFTGSTLVLRGFLRTEGVTGFAGLWAREDGDAGSVAFDNMQQRQLRGTTDWTQYTITLPVHKDGRQLYIGVLMSGTGKAWADDLELLVDGKPIWEAPKVERPKTALDLDHEFDKGSGIAVNELSSVQVANLATLGKVWGFLKYHHPEVVSGKRHWDYDLFRVLPKILAAAGRPRLIRCCSIGLPRWARFRRASPAPRSMKKISSYVPIWHGCPTKSSWELHLVRACYRLMPIDYRTSNSTFRWFLMSAIRPSITSRPTRQ